jgi:hypothetical protein
MAILRHWQVLLLILTAELGIIGNNSTSQQQINQSTFLIVGYRLTLETAFSVCRLKTKSDD